MRLAEVEEGREFTTRLTKRRGRVVSHYEGSVQVEWEKALSDFGTVAILHSNVDVDVDKVGFEE